MPRKKSTEEIVEEAILGTAKKAGATAKKASTTAKKATKKATEDAMVVAQGAVKKADEIATQTKQAVAKAAKKPLKEEVYLQYAGKEFSKDELIKKVKDIWTKEMKNRIGDIATLALYLKPEENKAYFVINGEVSGSIDL